MAQVAILPTPFAADEAWERYADLARRAGENPRLLTDRAFHEEMLRAHRDFRQVFEALEGAR